MDKTFDRGLFIASIGSILATILWIASWIVGIVFLKLDHREESIVAAFVIGGILVIITVCVLIALGFNIYDVLSDNPKFKISFGSIIFKILGFLINVITICGFVLALHYLIRFKV